MGVKRLHLRTSLDFTEDSLKCVSGICSCYAIMMLFQEGQNIKEGNRNDRKGV